jgi:hypothetical protein
MTTLMDMVGIFHRMTPEDMQDLAEGLVWFDPCQAERLRNCIIVAQQDKDLGELELQKQQEMMSRDSDMEYVNV